MVRGARGRTIMSLINHKIIIKDTVKKIFDLFGIEIVRKKSTRGTMQAFLSFIAKTGFHPKTIIDVGVAYGTPELYQNFPKAHYLLIEPLAEWLPVLEDICQRYDAEYVLAAAGPQPGIAVINVHDNLSGSSLLKESEGKEADGIPREVPIIKIDDICEERNLTGPFFVKIDTQGYELSVLAGASNVLADTELVILEVQLWPFLIDSPLLHDVVGYMHQNSFVAYDMFDLSLRPLDNALGFLNIAFVKGRGFFRKIDHFYSTEQRQHNTACLKAFEKYVLRQAKRK
jgi:FkbM family methyltransferase